MTDFFLTEDDLRAMRRRVRASPEAQYKALWMLLCQEAILADRAALSKQADQVAVQAEPVGQVVLIDGHADNCRANRMATLLKDLPTGTLLYAGPPAQQTEPVQEAVALKWLPAPRKTEWGSGMVSADVEIDRDHTLTLYCEEDQMAKVDAMFRRVFCKEEQPEPVQAQAEPLQGGLTDFEIRAWKMGYDAAKAEQAEPVVLTAADKAQCDGGSCGVGGYCKQCPKQQAEPVISKDAYDGAREDLAIWKTRALKAEELNRKFVASVNSQTFMGEPVDKLTITAPEVDKEQAEPVVEREPLTKAELLHLLAAIDPENVKRLPHGFYLFARAIEKAHGIGEEE